MKKDFDDSLKIVAELFSSISNKKDLQNLLEDLLTPKEVIEVSERVKIIKYLKEGLTQREVADKMWVSITTVNRWSRILKYWTGASNKFLN